MTLNLSDFSNLLSGIYQGKSLCRILQNLESKKTIVFGNVIEFGADADSKRSFLNFVKKKKIKKLDFSDKHLNHKSVIKADLNKKIKIKKNSYDSVLLFNVLEHIVDINNAKKEIYKIMKKNAVLIGSTPFLYEFHGAPSDYYRFTKPFLEIFFKKNFKIIKISNLGFGPFCLGYSFLSHFTRKIPFFNLFFFTITLFLDFILNFFVKYELKDIYPIAVFFHIKK